MNRVLLSVIKIAIIKTRLKNIYKYIKIEKITFIDINYLLSVGY